MRWMKSGREWRRGNRCQFNATNDSDPLLEMRNAKKSFGKSKVLDGVSLQVRRGEALGIIGPSGTGKSTVLRLLAGLSVPDEGKVLVGGEERPGSGLVGDEEKGRGQRVKVGMVFQSAALFDSLTVEENVGFTLFEQSDIERTEIRRVVEDCLSAVGLEGCEDKMPEELSGGMKKRVALARAILPDPDEAHIGLNGNGDLASEAGNNQRDEVVLYDEPTAGLDPVSSTAVEDLMRQVHRERRRVASYVVVTHQHSTIRRACDRIVFLHRGGIEWRGSVAEYDTPSDPLVRQFATGRLEGPLQW